MTDHLRVPYDALPDLFEGDLRYHAQRVTACGEYTAAVVLYAVADAIATERATTEGANDRASEAPTGAEFDAAVERAVRVLARDCQVCSEYLRMAECGGCPDCYSLATRIVSDVLLPEGGDR